MAINPFMHGVLKLLSYRGSGSKFNYRIDRMIDRLLHPSFKPLFKMWDHKIMVDGYELQVRDFIPRQLRSKEIILFFHGGGWVSGDIESYTKICADLGGQTGRRILSVDYRLAPEFPFPQAAEDCYRIARELYLRTQVPADSIILMGDSAGGNLAAVVSLMAADRGEFQVKRQILIYPSTYNDHSETSPFPSIAKNGKGFLLTSKKLCDYQDLYIKNKEDLLSPYFAPLLAERLDSQPATLVVTAEYDPLRDEGEEYAKKLAAYGNNVTVHRMKDALHGFFSLPLAFRQVKQCYKWINEFLDGVQINEQ